MLMVNHLAILCIYVYVEIYLWLYETTFWSPTNVLVFSVPWENIMVTTILKEAVIHELSYRICPGCLGYPVPSPRSSYPAFGPRPPKNFKVAQPPPT